MLFVIGDSTSIFYGPYLKEYIESQYIYNRKSDSGESYENLDIPTGANGGDSGMVLEYLKYLKESTYFETDVLIINAGLHDIKTNIKSGLKQVSIDQYRNNLEEIYQLSLDMNVNLVWINSTPVNDSIHNSKKLLFERYNHDVLDYNKAADSIFQSKGVPSIDLYSFSSKFPVEAYMDHVHYTIEYRKLQAAYIAGFIESLSLTQ